VNSKSGGTVEDTMGDLSDKQIVTRLQAGDENIFNDILSQYEGKVYGLALKFTRSEQDAEEVLQDTFLAVYKKIAGFEGRSAFSSWLYRITINYALMKLRKNKSNPTDYFENYANEKAGAVYGIYPPSSDWTQTPDEVLLNAELRHKIELALDRLPPKYKTVFLLRDVEGLTTDEACDILNISVPALKSRLHRARLYLRDMISQYLHPEEDSVSDYKQQKIAA
jgi:RNA polymerase sigma-70 factor (ECF subfamily)